MSNNLLEFLAEGAEKARENLEAAVLRLPEDKRNWKPAETSRSALDTAAECALLNGTTADMIANKAWPADFDFVVYEQEKAQLATDWNAVCSLLRENTSKVVAAIRAVQDEDFAVVFDAPWGPMPMTQVISYPYWNMSYHEGQINYIASLLGCLE